MKTGLNLLMLSVFAFSGCAASAIQCKKLKPWIEQTDKGICALSCVNQNPDVEESLSSPNKGICVFGCINHNPDVEESLSLARGKALYRLDHHLENPTNGCSGYIPAPAFLAGESIMDDSVCVSVCTYSSRLR